MNALILTGNTADETSAQTHVYACEDCDWKGTVEQMAVITDIEQRVLLGELMAAGCCPSCGSLIGVADRDVPQYTLEAAERILAQRAEGHASRLAQALDDLLKSSSIDEGGLVVLKPESHIASKAVIALADYKAFAAL